MDKPYSEMTALERRIHSADRVLDMLRWIPLNRIYALLELSRDEDAAIIARWLENGLPGVDGSWCETVIRKD